MASPDTNSTELSILVAHGSRVAAANDAHVERCHRLDASLPSRTVRAGFLELATPSVSEAIDTAVADGFTTISLVPFFLHGGKHTTVDLPAIVSSAADRHPSARFILSDHLGHRPELDAMLTQILDGSEG